MVRFLAPAAIVCGLLLSFSAAAQDALYVGNSGASRSGGAGLLELNEECVAEFGDGARICTSLDIIQSLQTGAVPARENNNLRQWVAPTIVGGTSAAAIDASGLSAAANQLTCNGWSNATTSFKGLTIDDFGRFSLQLCNGSRQIACCTAAP